jgi:hypothetical protein
MVTVASFTAIINRPRRSRTVSGGSAGVRKLFLECQQRFGFLQPRRQAPILLLQFLQLRIDRCPLPPALLRCQPVLALSAPGHQVRGVEPLFPQERAELTRPGAPIRLPEDFQFVVRREPSSGMPSCHLGIGWGGRRLAHDRGRPTIVCRTNSCGLHPSIIHLPALNSNFRGVKCLTYLGREGWVRQLLLQGGCTPRCCRGRLTISPGERPSFRRQAASRETS